MPPAADQPGDSDVRPGRPRDPSRDGAILAATMDLLGEVGFEQVTVRAIAQRSGTGLATIYRRWPTKEKLVIDAVGSFGDFTPDPGPDDDPYEALVRRMGALLDVLQGSYSGLIPNLLGQLHANPHLAEILREHVAGPRLTEMAELFASLPGVSPDRVTEAVEMLPASVFFQTLVLGRRLDEDDLRRVVDLAVRAASA